MIELSRSDLEVLDEILDDRIVGLENVISTYQNTISRFEDAKKSNMTGQMGEYVNQTIISMRNSLVMISNKRSDLINIHSKIKSGISE